MIGCGITTYNRLEADKKLVESLNKAYTDNIVFHVFKDGPEYPTAYSSLNGKVIVYTEKHQGLPLNVWKCINTVFDHHKIGFFLENDVVIAQNYFTLMRALLENKGGVVSSTTIPKEGKPVREVETIAGNNWATTRGVWLDTKPLLINFIEDMKTKNYLKTPAKYLQDNYGSATQDHIRSKAFGKAGHKIWQTTFPKVRITVEKGIHGAGSKQLKITQKDIDEAHSNHTTLLG